MEIGDVKRKKKAGVYGYVAYSCWDMSIVYVADSVEAIGKLTGVSPSSINRYINTGTNTKGHVFIREEAEPAPYAALYLKDGATLEETSPYKSRVRVVKDKEPYLTKALPKFLPLIPKGPPLPVLVNSDGKRVKAQFLSLNAIGREIDMRKTSVTRYRDENLPLPKGSLTGLYIQNSW